jgi:hypothetical protein
VTRIWYLAALQLGACSGSGTTWLGAEIAHDSAAGEGNASGVPADFFARYEAESPNNRLTFPVESIETDTSCGLDGVTEGANCSSGGKYVAYILGRSPCAPPTSTTSYDGCQNEGGGVQFIAVSVPVDATYDVTWWYHCGAGDDGRANVFGDTSCGGLDYGSSDGIGCRPHLIDVNGVPASADLAGQTALYFQFPCYPADWGILHGATTALPLKAGANTIYIHAPGATDLDAADVDAIDVQAADHGSAAPPLWPRLITPVLSVN